MNVIEHATRSCEIHDPCLPTLLAAPICLALDAAGLAWHTGATIVDVGDRIGSWIWLACRRLPKPPDLP